MAAVFDCPVATIGKQHLFWIGLLWCSACNTISNFAAFFAGFFIEGFPLHDKGLSDMGKIQVRIELGCDPDFAGFNPAVVGWVVHDKIRFPAVFEKQSDILIQTGLVVFDGKVVMSAALLNQISGDFTLG